MKKMSNLWIFGDSYGANCHEDNHWIHELSNLLSVDDAYNFCIHGVGNDYIGYQLSRRFKKFNVDGSVTFANQESRITKYIQPEDYVVILITPWYRQWHIDEAPEASHLPNLDNPRFKNSLLKNPTIRNKHVLEGQYENARHWFYTRNDAHKMYYERFAFVNFLQTLDCNLAYIYTDPIIEADSYNIKTIQKGNLDETSTKEFKDEDTRDRYHKKNNNMDFRIGHLSIQNHKILAKKIFTYFENGDIIDLTTDFLEGLYQ